MKHGTKIIKMWIARDMAQTILGRRATCFFFAKPKLDEVGFWHSRGTGRWPVPNKFGMRPGKMKSVVLKIF